MRGLSVSSNPEPSKLATGLRSGAVTTFSYGRLRSVALRVCSPLMTGRGRTEDRPRTAPGNIKAGPRRTTSARAQATSEGGETL